VDSDRPRDERFDRQVRFAPLGRAGQARLEASRVLLVGCGALGGVLAQTLTRAGVGDLVLVDRDVVELTNLPRQVLFDERHAREGTPKVDAAVEGLRRIGGPTRHVPHAVHLDAGNLRRLAAEADLILDGTDNLATRYLLNDYCVERGLPWVYAGVVGASGVVLPVIPGRSACLRCFFPDPPPPGTLPTCDSAGVLLPAVAAVASLQAGFALRILADASLDGFEPALVSIDVWSGGTGRIDAVRRDDCPCCGARRLDFLDRPPAREPVLLCGRRTVQMPARGQRLDLAALAGRLRPAVGEVSHVGPLVRFELDGHRFTVFGDGRALIEGLEDVDRARALYDRVLG